MPISIVIVLAAAFVLIILTFVLTHWLYYKPRLDAKELRMQIMQSGMDELIRTKNNLIFDLLGRYTALKMRDASITRYLYRKLDTEKQTVTLVFGRNGDSKTLAVAKENCLGFMNEWVLNYGQEKIFRFALKAEIISINTVESEDKYVEKTETNRDGD